ncbi:hypothetical protein AA313_de0205984 [Arthrobotrys entomopaga]|nr:hypothetical protein AA313_de0205984 [Arthrobotrys entomopaga]
MSTSTPTDYRHHRPGSSAAGSKSKAMLSSALQKANTAVLLDNANNIEGAMEAYSDACALLGHVMMRAGVDEDRRKLQQIDDTMSFDSDDTSLISSPASPQQVQVPPRRESLLPESLNGSRVQNGANGARPAMRRGLSHDALVEDEEYVPEMKQNYGNDFRGSPRKDARTSYIVGRAQSPQFVQKSGFRTSVAILAQPSVVQIDSRPTFAHKRDRSLSRITQQSQAPSMTPSRLPPTQMHAHLPPQMPPPSMPPPMGPPPSLPPSMPPPALPPPSLPPPSLPPQAPPPQAPPPAIPTLTQQQQQHLQQVRNGAVRPSVVIPQRPPIVAQVPVARAPTEPPPKTLQTPSPQKQRQIGHSRDVSEASTSWLHNFDDDDGTESPTSSFGGTSPRKPGIPVPYQNNHMYDSELEVLGVDLDAAVDAAWDGFSSDAESDFEQGVVMSYGIKRLTQQPVKLMHAQSAPMLRKKAMVGESTGEEEEEGEYDAHDVRRTVMLASQRLSKLGLDIDIGPSFEESFGANSPMTREQARRTLIAQTALLDQEIGHDFDDDYMTDDTSRSHGPAPLNLDITRDIIIEDAEPTPAARDSRRRSSNIIPALDTAFQPIKRLSAQGEVESSVDGRDGDDEEDEDEDHDPMDVDKDMNVVAQLGEFKFDLDSHGNIPPDSARDPKATWDEVETTLPQGDESMVMNPTPAPMNRTKERYSGVLDRRMSGRPLSGLGPLTIETNPRQSRMIVATATKVEEDEKEEEEEETSAAAATLPPTTEEPKDSVSDTSAWNASTIVASEFSPRTIEQNLTAAKLERQRNSGTDDGSSDHTHFETLSPRTRQTLRGTGGILRQTQSHVNLKSGRMGSFPESDSPGHPGLHSSASSQNLRSAKFPPRTPMSSNHGPSTGLPTGGFHLFDNRIHSPIGSRGGNGDSTHPVPLEPMPTEQLAKTFWLMRSLNNAISNPHGGYLSKKLFIPREMWLMKGVKLKCIEEKIVASENLILALNKLALVDRSDSELLLKELQDLESVMTRTEAILAKKLGSDVGASGASAMFKGQDGDGDTMGNGIDSGVGMKGSSGSSGGRSYWKKLRSKNTSSIISSSSSSYAALPSARSLESYSENMNHGGGGGVGYGAPGHEMENGEYTGGFTGPFAGYMHALSKLFEAAQVLGKTRIPLPFRSGICIIRFANAAR